MAKEFVIVVTTKTVKDGEQLTFESRGSLNDLKDYFRYDLLNGSVWSSKSSEEINVNPETIEDLIDNLNKSSKITGSRRSYRLKNS